MSIQSIGQRVALNHCLQRFILEHPDEELVVPTPWAPEGMNDDSTLFKFKPVEIQHIEWQRQLQSLIEEGVRSGFFGDMKKKKIISRIFKEATEGLCYGFSECLSSDRSPRVSIEKTCQQLVQDEERPFFSQILHTLRCRLQSAIRTQERLHEDIDKACRKGKSLFPKKSSHPMHEAMQKAVTFWKKNGLSRVDETPMIEKKFALTATPGALENPEDYDILSKKITIGSEEKKRALTFFIGKIRKLERDIIGPKLNPTRIFRGEDCWAEAAAYCEKNLGKIREFRFRMPEHVQSFFYQNGSYYEFRQEVGLVHHLDSNKNFPKKGDFDAPILKIQVFTR